MKNEDLVKASHSLIFLRRDLERAQHQSRGDKRLKIFAIKVEVQSIQARLMALLPPSQREPNLI